MNDALVHLGIGLLTVGGTVAATLWAGAKNAGRSEQKIASIGDELKRLDRVDRDQWKALGEVNEDVGEVKDRVSRVEGRLNGKAHGAGK